MAGLTSGLVSVGRSIFPIDLQPSLQWLFSWASSAAIAIYSLWLPEQYGTPCGNGIAYTSFWRARIGAGVKLSARVGFTERVRGFTGGVYGAGFHRSVGGLAFAADTNASGCPA